MILSKENLKKIQPQGIVKPEESIFHLPEKVLQFGTGVLLRGLPDYFIDKANRQGIFNGRVVVIKSTAAGSSSEFDDQDGLYTLSVKGIENAKKVEEDIICSAISKVISASTDWKDILKYAHKPEMEIVISNTTEVGLQLLEEDINQNPPSSFPAKLLAFLVERYKAFQGDPEKGMVIIPTELIPDNGKKLKQIILDLAKFNKLDNAVVKWLTSSNSFCSSLVDRIVPGKPDNFAVDAFNKRAGYNDKLLTACEVYRLWAIEGDEHVAKKLSFSRADEGVIVAPDIQIYRELKLRLLNGTHTLSCGTAYLAGFETVIDGMEHEILSGYARHLMINEIAAAIPYPIDENVALEFSNKVLDRFKNPFIKHFWLSITVQYSMKIKMRVLPVLLQYYKNFNKVPQHIAIGFASWILFMKAIDKNGASYFGMRNGVRYQINDDKAEYFYALWEKHGEKDIVHAVLKDQSLWETDLTTLPGFEGEVSKQMKSILDVGVLQTIRNQNS